MHFVRDETGSFKMARTLLETIVHNQNDSLIDLCCCHGSLTCKLKFNSKVFIDIIPRNLDDTSCQKDFIQADVLGDNPVFDKHYSVAMCLDGIEHLKKEEGFQLVERMKNIADVSVIFTPSDAWMMESEQSDRYHNDPESHKSLWSPADLEGWASVLFPRYHESLGIGAFFSWYRHGADMEADARRVGMTLGWCS